MPATKSDNMLSSLRLGVIERLARSFWAGTLPEDVDRIPLLMRPRGSEIMSRCCIYKDRAILRERLRAAMGFRLEDETDDSIPLRAYAEEALERTEPNWPILTVCDIACQGCMRARYYVTDACQGCVARSCVGHLLLPRPLHHRPRQVPQLRHVHGRLPLPCHRAPQRPLRDGLPGARHPQGRQGPRRDRL